MPREPGRLKRMSIATTVGDALAFEEIDFRILRHRSTHSPAQAAERAGIPPQQLARAVLLNPLSEGPARDLADLDLWTGRFEDARGAYERARNQARTPMARADAVVRLKRYHRFRGELEAAIGTANAWIDELARAALPVPDYVRLDDVELYLDAGLVGEAAALVEEVAASNPWLRDFRVPHGRILVALESQGVAAALELHEPAAEVADTSVYQNFRATLTADLGRIRERAGDYAAAAESYRAALDILADGGILAWSTDRVNFGLGAARALRKAGRLDESEAELRQVLLYIPAHPNAHLELALLMEERGDTVGAIEHLQSALAAWENADESYEPAQEARRKLAELGGNS
jgi:tetratricopeptide (TPR) repeat protein